jgi:quercetin dioxygenase-like cupin family protein
LPGQSHPYHFHRLKEETFQVLWGEIYLDIDGKERLLRPGDTAVVLPGAWHKFRTDSGCIVEEISTTHHNNDSVYKDAAINKLPREERKTVVKHWGRFEIA